MEALPAIKTFQYELHDVRVINEDENYWFIEADIKRSLGKDISYKTTGLDDKEKRQYSVLTPGGVQQMNAVSESGLYRMLMRSNMPEARKFQDWVVSEVLPSIRKSGLYEIAGSSKDDTAVAVQIASLMPAITGMLQTMQLMVGMGQQTNVRLEADAVMLADHDARLKRVEAVQTSGSGYMTLIGYGLLKNFPLSVSEARSWGIKARAKAKELGIKVGKVPDERWGTVNSYPVELLDELFGGVIHIEDVLRQTSHQEGEIPWTTRSVVK